MTSTQPMGSQPAQPAPSSTYKSFGRTRYMLTNSKIHSIQKTNRMKVQLFGKYLKNPTRHNTQENISNQINPFIAAQYQPMFWANAVLSETSLMLCNPLQQNFIFVESTAIEFYVVESTEIEFQVCGICNLNATATCV